MHLSRRAFDQGGNSGLPFSSEKNFFRLWRTLDLKINYHFLNSTLAKKRKLRIENPGFFYISFLAVSFPTTENNPKHIKTNHS